MLTSRRDRATATIGKVAATFRIARSTVYDPAKDEHISVWLSWIGGWIALDKAALVFLQKMGMGYCGSPSYEQERRSYIICSAAGAAEAAGKVALPIPAQGKTGRRDCCPWQDVVSILELLCPALISNFAEQANLRVRESGLPVVGLGEEVSIDLASDLSLVALALVGFAILLIIKEVLVGFLQAIGHELWRTVRCRRNKNR